MKFTNDMQNQVKDFHLAFGHPVSDKPTLPTLERFTNRKGWGAIEEAVEQLHTLSRDQNEFDTAIQTIHDYVDQAAKKQLNKEFITDETEKIVALADGLADELYFLLGDMVEAGVDIEPVLSIVQNSNMSKLFDAEDGTKYAKEDENGKIIKSPNFFEPEPFIKEEILRQLNK